MSERAVGVTTLSQLTCIRADDDGLPRTPAEPERVRQDTSFRHRVASPYIAEIDADIKVDVAVELEAAMSEISRLDSTDGSHLAALSTLLLRTESVASSKN